MSKSKEKSKKRRLSDSDPLFILPISKRQKLCHPSINRVHNNILSLMNEMNGHHVEMKELSPSPLLFINDNDDNKNKRISTPMGFSLCDSEIISMILEYLSSSGYVESVKCLSAESGISNIFVSDEEYIKEWVLNGDFDSLIEFYDSFDIDNDWMLSSRRCNECITASNLFYSKILIIEQKFFELIYSNAPLLATRVLNTELIPLISPSSEYRVSLPRDIDDISLISSLISGVGGRKDDYYYDSLINNSLYPVIRWNKLCHLLFIKSKKEIESELMSLSFCFSNIVSSRYKLYDSLQCKLIIRGHNHSLLNIFDSFVKCRLFECQHFNLRSCSIELNDVVRDINIPSSTYYILNGHYDEINHLSFDVAGQWLISSSNDKRTLIWDFKQIDNIQIMCDILHYLPVTMHELSRNRKYLITISEYQANFDDFKHDRANNNHIRRSTDEAKLCNNKSQFKLNIPQREDGTKLMMETERGCNIYLWSLDNHVNVNLYRQYHHYRSSASVCWTPDSKYYFITSCGNDIDLYCIKTGDIITTLPANGNLMTDLRLTNQGYRLCVTINQRDIRVYTTDFNIYYAALKRKDTKAFIPWLHFTDKNHINLFQNNISKHITKALYHNNERYNDYNDIMEHCNITEEDSLQSEDTESGESLQSLDDKLWIWHEEQLDLDKKSQGELRNDIIVSSQVSYGGEHEYLLVMVHAFNIENKYPMRHPIILMIDLRSIDLNHNFNIKFFYGFKQNRYKLQCGFGGYLLPPISNESNVYMNNKYNFKSKLNNKSSSNDVNICENKKDMDKMIKNLINICIKYPQFLPKQINNNKIESLFKTLPVDILEQLNHEIQSKVNTNDIQNTMDIRRMDIGKHLLEFEVANILNEDENKYNKENISKKCIKLREKRENNNIKKRKTDSSNNNNYCFSSKMNELIDDHHLLMEMKHFVYKKKNKKKKRMKKKENEMEIKRMKKYNKKKRQNKSRRSNEDIANIDDNDSDYINYNKNDDDYNKNCSLDKLNHNEYETINKLINNNLINNDNNNNNNNNNNNTLLKNEYIDNDYFGGHHFIISGSEDGNVCIWNRITQKIIKLAGHTKSVNCVVWNPKDSFILVSGGDDAQIRVWGPKKH